MYFEDLVKKDLQSSPSCGAHPVHFLLNCDPVQSNLIAIQFHSNSVSAAISQKLAPTDDYGKDGSEEYFFKMHCVRVKNLQRIYWGLIIERKHLGKKFLATIFSVIMYLISLRQINPNFLKDKSSLHCPRRLALKTAHLEYNIRCRRPGKLMFSLEFS